MSKLFKEGITEVSHSLLNLLKLCFGLNSFKVPACDKDTSDLQVVLSAEQLSAFFVTPSLTSIQQAFFTPSS